MVSAKNFNRSFQRADVQGNRTHGMPDSNQPPAREVECHRSVFVIGKSPQSCKDQIDGSGVVLPTDFIPEFDISPGGLREGKEQNGSHVKS